jgi:hypothetical protein
MMVKLGESELTYSSRSTKERAILLAAFKIPEMMKSLAEHEAYSGKS